jgi:capsule polysaccharide export protein KpsE/RkpR
MQAEVAEVKQAADKQVEDAKELVASVDDKLRKADAKLFEVQAVQAEASRIRADSARKIQEVEAREDALGRERQGLSAE